MCDTTRPMAAVEVGNRCVCSRLRPMQYKLLCVVSIKIEAHTRTHTHTHANHLQMLVVRVFECSQHSNPMSVYLYAS